MIWYKWQNYSLIWPLDMVPVFYLKINDIFPICLYQIYKYIKSLKIMPVSSSHACTIHCWILFWQNPPTQPAIKGECILAVNKHGIHFLSLDTHETILHYSFSEVLSTRRYRSDSGDNYLDMKLGNLMVQKIVRIETNQGSDISNLIGQYMQVINRHKKRPNDKMSLQRYHWQWLVYDTT